MRADQRRLLVIVFAAMIALAGCKRRKATNVARVWLTEGAACVEIEGGEVSCPLVSDPAMVVPSSAPPALSDCSLSPDRRTVKCRELAAQTFDVNVKSAAAGIRHACAVGENGELWCWGDNRAGQLGDGTRTSRNRAMKVPLEGVADIVCGDEFSCARSLSGTVACWGANNQAQLGDGSGAASPVPRPVFGLSGVDQIAAGRASVCIVGHDKGLKCWGKRWDAAPAPYTVPTPIPIKH